MKTIAILGPTACGKTALSIDIALRHNCNILSLDSLSIYKEIDIASAKPSVEERQGIVHFGIDVLSPSEHFDVTMFFDLYKQAKEASLQEGKHLVIVGGTGFYLKAMMEGLSEKPQISLHVKQEIEKYLFNLEETYDFIREIDSVYAEKIASTDRYRIEKWLEIFLSIHQVPSIYLSLSKKEPILQDFELFEVDTPKDILKERIEKRTSQMLTLGLLEEVFGLEKRYSRAPNCMKAIGIKEVLDYFDGKLKLLEVEERIAINTLHLAKRQRTFNTSQFPSHTKQELRELKNTIDNYLK